LIFRTDQLGLSTEALNSARVVQNPSPAAKENPNPGSSLISSQSILIPELQNQLRLPAKVPIIGRPTSAKKKKRNNRARYQVQGITLAHEEKDKDEPGNFHYDIVS